MSTPNYSFFDKRVLPVIIQTETAECGFACLAMISTYWGKKIDIYNMRKLFSYSTRGINLRGIMESANSLGLETNPVKIDLEDINHLALPCILHWEMDHFVVLKKINKKSFTIHDPAFGEVTLSTSEFSKKFTGVALELNPSSEFKEESIAREYNILDLMGNVKGFKSGLLQIFAVGIAMQVFVLIMPFYLQWIVDEAIPSRDNNFINLLGLGFVLVIIIQALIGFFRVWLITIFSSQLNFQWAVNSFSHLLKLPISYFEKRHLADIVGRFSSIDTIQQALTSQFVEGVIDGVLVLVTLVAMSVYSPLLAFISVVTALMYYALRHAMYKPLRNANMLSVVKRSAQQAHFYETIKSIQAVRIFNKSQVRLNGWKNNLVEEFNSKLTISKITAIHKTLNFILFNIQRVLIVWIASLNVLDNSFSIGMLFAFISYQDQFNTRVSFFIDRIFDYKIISVHGERVADIVLTPVEQIGSNVSSNIFYDKPPSIEFKNVFFRYSDNDPYVIKDFNLFIESGEYIAITGKSGCGKTTLGKLLLGLLEPTSGEILVDGKDIRKIGLNNYRKMVAAVMQSEPLFSGTISDNISFFDQIENVEEITNAAKLASIHDDIIGMPMNYNTVLGDTGSGLSGGQIQRILLARALYSKPKLILLDEATSNLDTNNELFVNNAISSIEATRVTIAHRVETIKMANVVVVMEDGKISSSYRN